MKKEKGQLHIGKCLLTLCFLEDLNVGNSNLRNKNIAEVDATGGYNTLPRGVQRVQCTLTHTFVGAEYMPTAWVSSLFVFSQGFPTT